MNDTYLYLLPMWLGCGYMYTLCAALFTLMSYMHVVLWGTSSAYMHVDLRLFLNLLVFKQVMINGIVDSNKMLKKMGMF